MGRKLRQREEELLIKEQKIADRLRDHRSQQQKPPILDWRRVTFKAIDTYRSYWINNPSTWVNTKKTKNMDTLRTDMIRHVFGVYHCPPFLEKIWLPEPHAANRPGNTFHERENINASYIPWYLAVAQGGSLYKSCSKGILSKKETHSFIHAPKKYKIKNNIWWARAFCESDNNLGISNRIAQSKLADRAINNEFWISIMRFFVRYPTTLNEMNDLIDYFYQVYIENDNYSIKGRSLEAVRRSCEEWHRFLNKQKTIGGGTWDGSDFDNWKYTTGKDEHKIIWRMTQINTGNELLKEGQAMRHCVVAYKRDCVAGTCSIWSLTSLDMIGNHKRNLTVSLNTRWELTEARGLANRSPRGNENTVLDRWCSSNNLRRKDTYSW